MQIVNIKYSVSIYKQGRKPNLFKEMSPFYLYVPLSVNEFAQKQSAVPSISVSPPWGYLFFNPRSSGVSNTRRSRQVAEPT